VSDFVTVRNDNAITFECSLARNDVENSSDANHFPGILYSSLTTNTKGLEVQLVIFVGLMNSKCNISSGSVGMVAKELIGEL